ncbi:hypothetical protein GS457_27000 [Rhodococcus hoagii]|nr:hypothetical protein [Prescottella equi]
MEVHHGLGSLTAAIGIPFGSADLVLAGIIDSVDYVVVRYHCRRRQRAEQLRLLSD